MIKVLVPDMPTTEELTPYFDQIHRSGCFANGGAQTVNLETVISGITGAESAVAVANGTIALVAALEALELPVGSRVACPAFTFAATAQAIVRAGYEPVFYDVSGVNWQLRPEDVLPMMHVIDAVVPVAALGQPVFARPWNEFQEETGIPVVIDAAGALGLQDLAGTSLTACFSLHATKAIGAGEGGAVAGPLGITAKVRRKINFGFENGAVTDIGQINGKMSEYAAAIALASIARFKQTNQLRNRIFELYQSEGILNDYVYGWRVNPNTLFTVLVDNPVAVGELLRDAGVETRRWYLPLIPNHPAFNDFMVVGDLPVSKLIDKQMLGLPFHTKLSEKDIKHIVRSLRLACWKTT